MPSSDETLKRMDRRVEDILADIPGYLDAFENAELFTGPSAYFHAKTMCLRNQAEDLCDVLWNDDFLESLYATLTAWGMHRMGPGNTKLLNFTAFCQTIRAQEEAFVALNAYPLHDLPEDSVPHVAEQIWACLAAIKVSPANARMVSSTKVCHHILPQLIPPIDREYTLRFFYGRSELTINEGDAFVEMFRRLYRIASEVDVTPF